MGKFTLVSMMVIMMLLAACGQPAPDTSVRPTESPLPTAPVSPISPLPAPQFAPDAETQELGKLQAQVAEQVGISATALTLISVEEVTWPDASLGCPQPDMMYAQVLTPGWRMMFMDAQGKEYQVHTSEDRKHFIVCELPDELALPPTERDNPAVQAAIKTLVEQKGVAKESITVVSVSAVEWPNSCLGCETAGQRCLMVVTPGYRITLQSGAETYNLHTNRTGQQAIVCAQPSLTPPRSDRE